MKETQVILKHMTFSISSLDKQTYDKQSLFPLLGDSIKATPQRKGNVMPHTVACNNSNTCSLLFDSCQQTNLWQTIFVSLTR
jgi:hypothetical protein